jgi:hypothetical protein
MVLQISKLLKQVPPDLEVCRAPASPQEIKEFVDIRKRYAADPRKTHAERDKIRAFRLLKGMRRYLEIGTFDKFNLRYVMGLLNPAALVIDLDIAENLPARQRIETEMPSGQQYRCVVGDSSATETLNAVSLVTQNAALDAVFIDANHVAAYVMNDFAQYGELVSESGYVFFHDVRWEGGQNSKGVADALDVIQKFVPVYQILGDSELTHWYRPFDRGTHNWGGIALIRGKDYHDAIGNS